MEKIFTKAEDFSTSQSSIQYLESESMDKKLNYWKQKLSGSVVLQLPTDHPRPVERSIRGASKSFSIEKELSGKLQQLSQQQGTTLCMTLLAAFKVLLHRYSGQQDICVGSPVANRTQQEVEGLIGFFVNTLALRSEVKSEAPFTGLLQQVKVMMMEAYEHQDVPFEKVVEAVVKERDLSRHPLFQVMFSLQNTPKVSELHLGEVKLSGIGYENLTAQFDITFTITERASGLQGSVEYATDLYNESTIVRMMDHFKELLSSIVKSPEQKIVMLTMLTKAEEHQLLVEFNDTAVDYPKDKTIVDLFEEQVAKTPQSVAVMFEEEQLSYQQLNEKANQLAHYLRSKGVKEETLVPICIERSPEMITGILGILKAGGAYVPIDPEYPEERISYMLEDTGAAIVVSSKESRSKLRTAEGVEVIEMDGDWSSINGQLPATNDQRVSQPDHLAYVIYTSGSTGKPKGVMIEHRNASAFISWCRQEFSKSHFEIVYASTSICFDLSVFEIFYPLSIGKPVRIIENGLEIDKYLSRDRFVLINSVPVVVENLLKEETDLSNVSVINMAGEPISLYVQQNLNVDSIEVRNLYGPTEDTTYSTIFRLRKGMPVLIGKPISNTVIYILNESHELLPVGVTGEICIGGAGLARGYLNRGELTAEKFIADPFSTGSRIYKTGDIGRWLADGNIEYLGRKDNQVKIRGYRIELGEIENILQQTEGVSQAVVLAKADSNGSKKLVGYIVPGGTFNKEAIVTGLRKRLPEYMVPSVWLEMEAMPLTLNGKIDRKELPDPDTSELLGSQYVAPRNEVEEKLAAIWEELLGVEKVGIYDDFFELGANSIQAAQMFSKIRKALGKQLPLAVLFRAPTIEQLAIFLSKGDAAPWSSLVPIQPNGSKPPLFCMHAGAGTVLLYRSLSQHLGSDQPVYGLQAKGLNGNEPPHTRIEDMAAHYIKEIRTVQPEGPYFLGGYCLGGILAFEMAQQLIKQGQRVALIASMNGVSPNYTDPSNLSDIDEENNFEHNNETVSQSFGDRWKEFTKLDSRGKILFPLKWMAKKLLTYNQQYKIRRFFYNYYISRNLPLPEILGKIYFLETNRDIAKEYLPVPYPGKMIILRSPGIYHDPRLGWDGLLTEGIVTRDISGRHRNRRQIMNEPFVQQTAKELNYYLGLNAITLN